MSDQKAGTGAHTEATRDPGQPLGTAALGKERLAALYRISRGQQVSGQVSGGQVLNLLIPRPVARPIAPPRQSG